VAKIRSKIIILGSHTARDDVYLLWYVTQKIVNVCMMMYAHVD